MNKTFFLLFFIGRFIFPVGERRRGMGERRRRWEKGGEGGRKEKTTSCPPPQLCT